MATPLILSLLITSYLLGGIPTGYLVARRRGVDVREHGSGNIGATNVGRLLGSKAALITLAGDIFKGIIAALLPIIWSPSGDFHPALPACCALMAIIGHCFSPYIALRGGKGVAVGFGGFLTVTPVAAIVALVVFALVKTRTTYVSVASLGAVAVFLIVVFFSGYPKPILYLALCAVAVITARHSKNISRLWKGNERSGSETAL